MSCRIYLRLADLYVYLFLMGRIEMLVCQREKSQIADGGRDTERERLTKVKWSSGGYGPENLSRGRRMVLPLLHWFSVKDACALHRTFGSVWQVTAGIGWCCGTWWVEARGAAKHPTMHRAAPTPKSHPAQDVYSAKVEKPWSGWESREMLGARDLN